MRTIKAVLAARADNERTVVVPVVASFISRRGVRAHVVNPQREARGTLSPLLSNPVSYTHLRAHET